jgi:hypothetical protein
MVNVATSTIRKYVDIMFDALCDQNKLLSNYISIPFDDCLEKVIDYFHDLIGLFNICGAIHYTHIPLASFPNKKMTLATSDFFNNKKIS